MAGCCSADPCQRCSHPSDCIPILEYCNSDWPSEPFHQSTETHLEVDPVRDYAAPIKPSSAAHLESYSTFHPHIHRSPQCMMGYLFGINIRSNTCQVRVPKLPQITPFFSYFQGHDSLYLLLYFLRFKQTNVGGDGVKSRNRLIADLRDSFLHCGRTMREIRCCSQAGL